MDETRSKENAALRRASAKYADELVAIKSKSRERPPASEGDPPGGAEIDTLRTEADDNARLAEAYRNQRDKLQADWDAWEHSRDDGATVDDASLYGAVRSEASFAERILKGAAHIRTRVLPLGLVGDTPRFPRRLQRRIQFAQKPG